MTDDLAFLSIVQAADLIKARKLSPVELTQAMLARIDRYNDQLHAFLRTTPEAALAAARIAEAEIARGEWRGPLHGIPIGLKDIYDVEGLPTTCQSAFYAGHVADKNAFAVDRLLAAGAVLLGKNTTWEFAVGGIGFECPWPPARNPWDTTRDPGGSSSGSGAAVAAGLAIAAMGSDTGGSIRFPAAWCGLAGFKPTYGLVSKRGVFPLAYSLDHAGPLARTSADCAIMMQAIAGFDPDDPASVDRKPPDFTAAKSVKGLRIGVVRNYFGGCVNTGADTAAAIETALDVFRALGISVTEVTIPPLRSFAEPGVLISRSEAFAIHEANLRHAPHLYGAVSRTRIMLGAFVRASDYINAQRHRRLLLQQMDEIMEGVDLLVAPTVPASAPLLEAEDPADARERLMFTRPFNMTGTPVLSICTGFDGSGLPLSMQIAGRAFEDDVVLRVGAAFEAETGYHKRRPASFAA